MEEPATTPYARGTSPWTPNPDAGLFSRPTLGTTPPTWLVREKELARQAVQAHQTAWEAQDMVQEATRVLEVVVDEAEEAQRRLQAQIQDRLHCQTQTTLRALGLQQEAEEAEEVEDHQGPYRIPRDQIQRQPQLFTRVFTHRMG
ncbi:hypothetical protein M407DRAFT_33303 [Tulasnella calospora MUT 4182]|uniref:Uncharacterized protein n=1 Tax=Tulasnella calospora MUT 4182 TaxID=1051891 RepID=A0A0C3Q2K2_9AGAM|nr:hypothetical protein M407DRAFT_33303 [Tulasnella calospora MUT 4182]